MAMSPPMKEESVLQSIGSNQDEPREEGIQDRKEQQKQGPLCAYIAVTLQERRERGWNLIWFRWFQELNPEIQDWSCSDLLKV